MIIGRKKVVLLTFFVFPPFRLFKLHVYCQQQSWREKKKRQKYVEHIKNCASKKKVKVTHARSDTHTHTHMHTWLTHAFISIYIKYTKIYNKLNVHTYTLHITHKPKLPRYIYICASVSVCLYYMCSTSSQKCTIDISNSFVVRISNLLLFGSPFTLRNSW